MSRRGNTRRRASKALKPWREDIADHRKASGTSEYLCSQCQTLLPAGLGQEVWISSLPRILKHRKHCRLCRLLLKTLCLPEYDPFNHPQVAEYLDGPHIVGHRVKELNQEPIKQKRFRDWLMSNRRVWPFGEGKALPGEESTSVEGDSTHRMSKFGRSAADFALSASVSVATILLVTVGKAWLSPILLSSNPQSTIKRFIRRHLPCYIEVRRLPLTPSILDARLRGYGRGPRAQLVTLSHFNLAVEASPTYTYSTTDQPSLHYAFVLHPTLINVGISRMWLDHCERHHGSKCQEQGWSFMTEPPDFLRLIDIEKWCLIELHNEDTRHRRYVALSYIWGGARNFALNKSNIRQLHRSFGLVPFLEQKVPKTIRDAMIAVQQMGERYLWVDALCIQQDDRFEKHTQIESMDRIYGNAIVTVVAADSLNANAGISGVSPGSREAFQQVAKLNNGQHLLVHLPDASSIEKTPWNHRAWTLQELLLSRRLMIFAGGKLTWRCRGMTAHEDMPGSELGREPDPFPWLSIKPQYLGLKARKGYRDGSITRHRDGRTIVVRSGTFTEYVKVVEQYTHRDMRFPRDILRALAGLLRIFEQCFQYPISHGLPEALLDAAILWLPMEKLKRREVPDLDLPSWSWAGWVGRISYEKPFIAMTNEQDLLERQPRNDGQERFRPLVRWYTMNDGLLRAINGHGLGIPLSLADGRNLPIEWDGMPPGIKTFESLTELGLPETVLNTLDSTHLIFKTSISRKFQLGDSITDDALHGPLKFSLIRKTSQNYHKKNSKYFAGVVTLDGSSPRSLTGDSHALVVLSEAEYLCFGPEKVREYDDRSAHFPLYNVMLVEWNIDGRIARRLGIGRVYKDAWLASRAYVQTVILE